MLQLQPEDRVFKLQLNTLENFIEVVQTLLSVKKF